MVWYSACLSEGHGEKESFKVFLMGGVRVKQYLSVVIAMMACPFYSSKVSIVFKCSSRSSLHVWETSLPEVFVFSWDKQSLFALKVYRRTERILTRPKIMVSKMSQAVSRSVVVLCLMRFKNNIIVCDVYDVTRNIGDKTFINRSRQSRFLSNKQLSKIP